MNFLDDKEKMRDFIDLSKDEFLKSYSYLTEEEYNETRNLMLIGEYKEDIIEQTKNEISKLLKDNEEYEDYSIQYILVDKENPKSSFAIAFNADEIIKVDIISYEISSVAEWAYNVDQDIFEELENNKKIGYMSMDSHFNIWETINQWYPEDIEHKKGMQKYLKYCKDNKVTKEVIEKEVKLDLSIDAMKFYEKDKKPRER